MTRHFQPGCLFCPRAYKVDLFSLFERIWKQQAEMEQSQANMNAVCGDSKLLLLLVWSRAHRHQLGLLWTSDQAVHVVQRFGSLQPRPFFQLPMESSALVTARSLGGLWEAPRAHTAYTKAHGCALDVLCFWDVRRSGSAWSLLGWAL